MRQETGDNKLLVTLPRENISQLIVKRITDALISGELKPGDKIPTEQEFSKMLGVGRNVVREAIKVLEAFGVLEIRRAEGTFVVKEYTHSLLDPVLYGIILSSYSMDDLIDFKISLLNSLLYMAIQAGTDEEFAAFREHCENFKTVMLGEPDVDAGYAALFRLNEYLGQICKNPLLNQLDSISLKISKYTRILAVENSFKTDRTALADSYLLDAEVLRRRAKAEIPDRVAQKLQLWRNLLLPDGAGLAAAPRP